jgi:hypothetical protein
MEQQPAHNPHENTSRKRITQGVTRAKSRDYSRLFFFSLQSDSLEKIHRI